MPLRTTIRRILPVLCLILCFGSGPMAASEVNFTQNTQTAKLYSTHEITLRGNELVDNPFNTLATITFTPPSGDEQAKTVEMFYDGTSVWRGRAYVTETGEWTWRTASADDALLDGREGTFMVADSDLPGMLRKHPENPKHWATERGDWFINLNDTAYKFFSVNEPLWQEYAHDLVTMGITSIRSGALGGWEWLPEDEGEFGASNYPWDGDDLTRYNLTKFQNTDTRLQWLLNTYPEMYVQLILFGQIDYRTEQAAEAWLALPEEVRTNTMRYMLARWAAYPNVFWLTVNDLACGDELPKNDIYTREVGRYFAQNDPWEHLISTSPTRDQEFCFDGEEDADWVSYVHLQGSHESDALWVADYAHLPMHVFLAEDYYEQEHPTLRPRNPAYSQRWLFWSWLLEGGSANYGGRYFVIQPYSTSAEVPFEFRGVEYGGLVGLDSVPYIKPYFTDRDIDLTQFTPADEILSDPNADKVDIRMPHATVRGDFEEIIIYHPNAANYRRLAELWEAQTPQVDVDLSTAFNRYSVEWYRPVDGASQMGEPVAGGQVQRLTSPWQGLDVVIRLVKQEPLPPTSTPESTEEVTAEATETLTPEATEEATAETTETLTPEATAEVTETLMPEVTEEVTEEATAEVTETLMPEATEEVTEASTD